MSRLDISVCQSHYIDGRTIAVVLPEAVVRANGFGDEVVYLTGIDEARALRDALTEFLVQQREERS